MTPPKKCRRYSKNCILEASRMVKSTECSLHKAAEQWDVPYSSLRRCYLYGLAKRGRKPVFNSDQEKQIVYLASYGVKSLKEFGKFVFSRSKLWRVNVPASWVKKRAAGRKWIMDFLKRNYVAGLFVMRKKEFVAEAASCGNCGDCIVRECAARLCESCLEAICGFCNNLHNCNFCFNQTEISDLSQ